MLSMTVRLRGALVVAEVAVSIALLVGAGLLLRSFWSLSHVDPGVDVAGVLTFELSLPGQDYPDAAAVEAFFEELQPRLAALPGVDSVATASLLPLTGGFDCNTVSAAERPEPPHPESPCAETRTVTPSYFGVLALRLLDGRVLDARDRADAPPVTVITRTLAATLWPGETAVGKRLRAFDGELEVVGVVEDVKHLRLDQPSPPSLFMSRGQSRAAWQGRRSTLLLRTAGEPTALLPSARETVWSLDDTLPTAAETTLGQVVSGSLAAERLRTLLITAFALAATLLAALGLYGVLAFLVAQRRYEMAVRLALGSRRGGVVRLVVGQGLALVAAGAALGLAAAFALSHLLADLLYAVTPTDPVAFLAVALLMAAVGLVACWLPARRAASVDPAVALRG